MMYENKKYNPVMSGRRHNILIQPDRHDKRDGITTYAFMAQFSNSNMSK